MKTAAVIGFAALATAQSLKQARFAGNEEPASFYREDGTVR